MMMRDYPHGVGFGGYRYKIFDYTKLTGYFSKSRGTLGDPHHFILYYGTSAGIGSMVCLIGIIVATIKTCLSTTRNFKTHEEQVLGASILWGFVTYIVIGFLGPGAYYLIYLPKNFDTDQMLRYMLIDTGIFFWLSVGLIFGLHRLGFANNRKSLRLSD